MPAPAAAGVAAGGARVAGTGAAAGSTTATGSAGAKAAAKSSGSPSGAGQSSRALDLAAQTNAGGGDDDGGGNGGRQAGGGRGGFNRSRILPVIFGSGLLFFLVVLLPMVMMGASAMQCIASTTSAGTAVDWKTAGRLVGASTFTGEMGYRGDMLNEHLAFAELGDAGASVGDVMGDLPHKTKIRITRPDGSWVIASKMDVGSGGEDVKGHPRMIDIHVKAAERLGLPNPEAWLGLVKYKIVRGAQAKGPQWGGPDTSTGPTGSGTGAGGYTYPLAEQGERGGGVADHMARPFGNWMSDNAVDITVPEGTGVVAVGDGVIYRQSGSARNPSSNPAGYTLYLRSGGENFSYMHLNSFSVRVGQRVREGDVIGRSGIANGVPHLHFAAEGMNPETIVDGTSASGGGGIDIETLHTRFGIPKDLPPIYVAASEKYKLGIRGPSILAAINRIETNFGELANETSYAGAQGWMQFMPATWAAYGVDGDGDGTKDPTNKFDAIYSAANYLRASGAPGNWHDAIFAYNNAEWYVQDVLEHAEKYFPYLQPGGGLGADCGGGLESGPANIQEAITLRSPRKWVPIPTSVSDPGELIDARLLNAVVWMAREYGLHITQGAYKPGSPSQTHGWGTAVDFVPKGDQSKAGWDRSVLRLAKDLGWSSDCAYSGHKPVCKLVPAIKSVYYNGFECHGDPWHITGSCGAHIHVDFECSCTSYYSGQTEIATWVKTFPVGTSSRSGERQTSDRPKQKKGGQA